VRVETFAVDLSREDAVQLLADKAGALGLEIRTLINNAGFGLRGAFADQPLDRLIDMLNLNIVALTRLTGACLPPMLARGEGGIINVASTAAFQPGPYMSVYYASKAYVLSFSEAIAHELRGTGVVVTALCPGPTQSEFAEVAGMANFRLLRRVSMSSREVARLGLDGHRAGKALVIAGVANKLTPWASRLLPRGLTARLIARMQRK
jgi:short-subunit dehydrogenase